MTNYNNKSLSIAFIYTFRDVQITFKNLKNNPTIDNIITTRSLLSNAINLIMPCITEFSYCNNTPNKQIDSVIIVTLLKIHIHIQNYEHYNNMSSIPFIHIPNNSYNSHKYTLQIWLEVIKLDKHIVQTNDEQHMNLINNMIRDMNCIELPI